MLAGLVGEQLQQELPQLDGAGGGEGGARPPGRVADGPGELGRGGGGGGGRRRGAVVDLNKQRIIRKVSL